MQNCISSLLKGIRARRREEDDRLARPAEEGASVFAGRRKQGWSCPAPPCSCPALSARAAVESSPRHPTPRAEQGAGRRAAFLHREAAPRHPTPRAEQGAGRRAAFLHREAAPRRRRSLPRRLLPPRTWPVPSRGQRVWIRTRGAEHMIWRSRARSGGEEREDRRRGTRGELPGEREGRG
jgi:hypothetical protein